MMLMKLFGSQCLLALFGASLATAATAPTSDANPASVPSGAAGIGLEITMGTDLAAGACGTATTLDVLVGDEVNFCYRVTNNTSTPLAYQTLADDVDGVIASEESLVIAPGATLQYNRNRRIAAGQGGPRTTTWIARDVRPDYVPATRPGAFIDLYARPTATNLNPAGDGTDATGAGMVAVTMPFSFPFYGVPANQLCVGVDGGALVGLDSCILFPSANGIGPLPQPGMGTAMLPLWDDFAGGGGCGSACVAQWGAVFADTIGTAPNREYVIEWYNLRHEAGGANTDRATFELIIDEASGRIAFEYADVDYTAYSNFFGAPDICNGGVCASIGLQQDDAWAHSFSYLQAAVTNGSAIDWMPNAPATFSAQASVTLGVGKPVASLPASVTGSATSGGQSSAAFTLADTGDRDLHWTLDGAASMAGGPAASPAGTAVPAYVSRMLVADFPSMINTYLGFDAADPANNTPIAQIERIYDAGTFVDDDFSKEYMVNGWHYRGATAIFTTVDLETVDTATGAITSVGNTGVGPNEQIQGIAWDPMTSTLYAAITPLNGSTTTLASLDRYSGAVTRLMPVTGVDFASLLGLAIDANGRMYSIEQNSMSLVEIDKTSGEVYVIGPLGDESALLLAGPLAFDRPSGILYMSGLTADLLGGLYQVDLATGHAGLLGTIGTDQELASALAIATAGGPCAGAAGAPWLSASPAAGVVSAGGNAAITVNLDATGMVAGTYEADLCLRSDDPYRHAAPVHVTFTVSPDQDVIYRDGFDDV